MPKISNGLFNINLFFKRNIMKISNFRRTHIVRKGTRNQVEYALVDISTTGFLFFKKPTVKKDVPIARPIASFWAFVDTGEFTPGTQVETLARSFDLKGLKPIGKLLGEIYAL